VAKFRFHPPLRRQHRRSEATGLQIARFTLTDRVYRARALPIIPDLGRYNATTGPSEPIRTRPCDLVSSISLTASPCSTSSAILCRSCSA